MRWLAPVLVVAALGAGEAIQPGAFLAPVSVAASAAILVPDPGDDLDRLAATVAPPARWAGYRADFTLERRQFAFAHAGDRTETKDWLVVRDGGLPVALVRSGDIQLLAPHPEARSATLAMPTERYHLDNLLGPSLPIHQGGKVWTHGSIYDEGSATAAVEAWSGDGATLTLHRRRHEGDRRFDQRVTLRVDPVYGYRLDAVAELALRGSATMATFPTGTFVPGCYEPWTDRAWFARTVFTPADIPGWRGWANHPVAMDRCDTDRRRFAWRDGGFIAYLPEGGDGWSPVRTRSDGCGPVTMSVCNAHNDFHITVPVLDRPADGDGWRRWRFHHRLMALPPELGRRVWEGTELMMRGQKAIVLAVGRVEDFEHQPKPVDEHARGLVWTSDAPPLRPGLGRAGGTALEIRGRQRPNLPQLSLRPGRRYRIEGWFQVRPFTAEERVSASAAEARRIERLRAAGRPVPPPVPEPAGPPRAWIEAEVYEWSPYTSKVLETLRTTVAEATQSPPSADGWTRVAVEWTAPDWGPFIQPVLMCEGGVALLDDLGILEITDAHAR